MHAFATHTCVQPTHSCPPACLMRKMPQTSQHGITTGQLGPGGGWGLKLPESFLATAPARRCQVGTYAPSATAVCTSNCLCMKQPEDPCVVCTDERYAGMCGLHECVGCVAERCEQAIQRVGTVDASVHSNQDDSCNTHQRLRDRGGFGSRKMA